VKKGKVQGRAGKLDRRSKSSRPRHRGTAGSHGLRGGSSQDSQSKRSKEEQRQKARRAVATKRGKAFGLLPWATHIKKRKETLSRKKKLKKHTTKKIYDVKEGGKETEGERGSSRKGGGG